MNATELVTHSYYLSGVVARELEEVTGSQLSDGIRLLNNIINEKSATAHQIPFDTSTTFNGVGGQEEYPIAGLIDVTSLTFINSNVRYSMTWKPRDEYHGSTRILNNRTLPSIYTTNRTINGTTISVYFSPDQPYEFEVWGKFFLTNVTIATDLSTYFTSFFIAYLEFALAKRICLYNTLIFPPEKEMELKKQEMAIFEPEPLNMTAKIDHKFDNDTKIDYAAINIYRGLWPT